MTPNLAAAAVLFVAAQTCIVVSGFVMFAMIGEINRRVPDDQRISYVFGHYAKYAKILREYRRLYPSGRLALYHLLTFALAMILLLAFAVEFGFLKAFFG